MRITIAAVGKVREAYLTCGMEEYLKRLRRFADVAILEAAEEPAPETLSPAQQAQVKAREGERLARLLRDEQYLIALDLAGRAFSSEAFAAHLAQLTVNGHSDLVFLIGGSLGLAPALLQRAHLRLSFGPMTFPHQLMRLVLLEQVYRGFKIMRGEPYHK